ncbi:MAG: hypothetical protein P1U64_08205 [Alcanivoracaceae bacterium]|nr:hypothetical protein [Alcanivoracaceae bacterium]
MNRNAYDAPQAEIDSSPNAEVTASVYSPMQIGLGTFIGGPFAAVYFLKANFDALQMYRLSRMALTVGGLFILCFSFLVVYLPEDFPNNVIPVLYLVPTVWLANKTQPSKQDVLESENLDFQSGWKVFGISILGMVLFVIVVTAIALGLDGLGLISVT